MIVLCFLIVALPLAAQPGAPPPDPGDPVPISGIGWLIGLGASLGIGSHLKSFARRFKK